jgi:hypothetical protein
MPDRAPRVRSAPGVLLHRDARRIEPDLRRGEPRFRSSRLSPWSVCPSFRPSGPAKLQPAVQAGAGPVRRLVRLRKAFPSARRFLVASLRSSNPAFLAESLDCPSSGVLVHLAEARLSSLLPNRGDSPNGCAPLAASAVRQVYSEERTRRVFRRCCGHRCRFSRVNFPFSLRGLLLREARISSRSMK